MLKQEEEGMVKRFAQLSVAVFLVLALATMATAAPNVAGVTNKGALLVFPLVMNTTHVKTAIFIGNDQTSAVMIKCYWMDQNQDVEDFHFKVTANEPIVFWSDDNDFGPPFSDESMGSLMCWAQDDADQKPVTPPFNHLYGTAMLSSSSAEVMYNAWAFTYSGAAIPITPDGVTLTLNGGVPGRVFDACPKYLVSTFMPDGAAFGTLFGTAYPALALWPCNQDLRQDREGTIVKVKIDAWDEYENKYTGAYQCFKCFYEGFLAGEAGKKTSWPQSFGKEKFTEAVLGNGVARIRVQGVNNELCKYDGKVPVTYDLKKPGLLGLLLYADSGTPPFVPVAGKHMVGAGSYPDGWILYDPAQSVEDAAGR